MKFALKFVGVSLALLIAVALLGVVLVVLRIEEPPGPAPLSTERFTGQHSAAIAKTEAWLSDAQAETGLPSIGLAVGVGGMVVWAGAVGYVDVDSGIAATPRHRYRVGSVAKAFTAVAMGKLVQDGRLEFDDDYHDWVPEFPEKQGPFSLRQLASHLAGVRHYHSGLAGFMEQYRQTQYDSVSAALELVADDPLAFPPGTAFQYSSYGYNLLSVALERAADIPYLELMQRTVFEPYAMDSSQPDYQDRPVANVAVPYLVWDDVIIRQLPANNSYKWAGGGFLSTPTDLVRFGNGLLQNAWLTNDIRDQLWQPQKLADGADNPQNYALGFRVGSADGRRVVNHGGGSVGGASFLLIFPEEQVVVAYATNSTAMTLRRNLRAETFEIAAWFMPPAT